MEGLSALLDDVYQKGLGVSRQHVLARRPYQDFSCGYDADHEVDEPTKEMAYLGGRLADRAFLNLPFEIRQDALRWQSADIDERELILQRVFASLVSGQWLKSRPGFTPGTAGSSDTSRDGIFPNVTKSWRRGRVQPNCLGLAQMLVGFARAAGARHMLFTPLVPSWYGAMRGQLGELRSLLRDLDTFPDEPYVRKWRRLLTRAVSTTLLAMNDPWEGMAHHALVIWMDDKGADTRVVDPYMNVYDFLEVDADMEDMVFVTHRPKRLAPVLTFTRMERSVERALRGYKTRGSLDVLVQRLIGKQEGPSNRRQLNKLYDSVIDDVTLYIEALTLQWASWNPPVFEVARADMLLACFTVNHWSVVTGQGGGDILRIAAPEHIIRDQLKYLHGNQEFCDWFVRERGSGAVLPELKKYLASKKKERYLCRRNLCRLLLRPQRFGACFRTTENP